MAIYGTRRAGFPNDRQRRPNTMLVDLVQLRTFVAVAEEQHLTRAAERLYISQSAASAHIRALEDKLDNQLFVRTNRSLELTRAGQLLARKARVLLNEEALFASFARELRGKIEGKLIVASSSEIGTGIGEMMAALRSQHPLVSVELMARASASTHQGLVRGEFDVGVMLGNSAEDGLYHYKLTDVAYRVAGPIAWKDQIDNADWGDLAALPWLTPSTSSAHSSMLGRLFGDKGLELNSVIRFDNAQLGRAALLAGAGMLLLREDHVQQGVRDGHLAASSIAHTTIALTIAHQPGRRDDPLIQAFLDAATVPWPDMKLTSKGTGKRPVRQESAT
jgi:DNA-binding transcriptional LysR family regulator